VRGRHLTTAVTLVVLLGVLAVGAVVGARTLFAPLPSVKATESPSPSCATRTVKKGQRFTASQVQVSVFNAGTRAGLAQDTLSSLRKRGFKAGAVGNAPETSRVKVAQVWTTTADDTAARLVARQFGRSIKVRVVHRNLGPGVDVVVGDGLGHLVKAPRVMVAKKATSVCERSARR
jgi:LytR cell envelope-related transcriptional attenuator